MNHPHPFFGRINELKKLDALYNSGKFECVVLHGRSRVGKTALLREFIKGRNAVYFTAQETSPKENLEDFTSCLESQCPEASAGSHSIEGFDDAFALISGAATRRLIVVIDDYHYLAAACQGISELICSQIDKLLIHSKLMLVICGSSAPVMENGTLGYDSPFHGKRTASIKLDPFTFFEVKKNYGDSSPDDVAVLYGVTGGVPAYLALMNPDLPVEENIRLSFFDTSSVLFEEPANILRREVRDPAYYNSVLRAIASGCSKNSEIAAKVGLETSACTAYLKNLIALGFVSKHTPVTEKAGKKTIYEIGDGFFRFWYRFVPENASFIRGGMAERIWRSVAREMPSFMGKVFEDICREWLIQRNQAGRLPVNFVDMGRWWGTDPVWKTEVSIPIVAYSDDDHAVFGECVWSDDPADADVLNSLIERSRLLRYNNRYYYLFSRSGFSDECADLAHQTGANLVMFE